METGRAVMIRYQDDQGKRRAGSGLRIGGNRVLTAAHVAAGTGHTVILGSLEPAATVTVRSTDPEIDLAVLEISIPPEEGLPPLGYARVDRNKSATIEGCTALGYPAFKKDPDKYRRSVQVDGFIPTAEGLTARPGTGTTTGYLSLKATGPAIRGEDPLPGGDLEPTPWAGMSGAVAFDRNDRILGVVRHHNPAEGPGTLALTPLDAIDLLPEPERNAFWTALGIIDPDRLPRLPGRAVLLPEDFRALLQDPDYAVFAGRDDALQTVQEFLAGPGGILAVTAPAGLGKTALLASPVRDYPDRFAYHFFTNRYFASWLDEAFFLRNMLQQLEPASAAAELQTLALQALQTRFQHRLGELSGSSAQGGRVLLLDGLDEVAGWNPATYLAAPLPDGVHVIVSIRDTDPRWRSRYRIPPARLTVLPLDGFNRDAVTAVFASTGEHAAELIRQPGAWEMIMNKAAYTTAGASGGGGPVIHGADPLYVRFLAEDANDPAATLAGIADLPAGFTSYLDRWWDEISQATGKKVPLTLFAALTTALGPLTRQDLAAVAPEGVNDPKGQVTDWFDRKVLPRIRRFVTGNDTTGYSLAHPRLGEHLATKFTPAALETARKALLDGCAGWADNGSLYALTFYPAHLAETDLSALPGLYRDAGYLGVSISTLGIERVTGTLRSVLSRNLPADLKISLTRSLQLLDREAHHLRSPFPVADPAYVTRQLGLQALAAGDNLLADSTRQALLEMASGQLVPRWSTSQSNPALIRTLAGHAAPVSAVAITPDGTRALTGGEDATARVWDLATGTELHTLTGHTGRVTAVAITPDGTRALTTGTDGTARIWDLATGTELHTLTGHTGRVTAVAITPDGTRALTGGADGTARIWDLATGTELHTLTGHTGSVTAVAITPDGTRALTGGADGTARIWALATGTELHTLSGHIGWVHAVAITPDGIRAVVAGVDATTGIGGTAILWDLSTGTELHTFTGSTATVYAVAISPDGTRALTGSADGTARIWDLATGTEMHTLSGHIGWVHAVAITPDGTRAVATGVNATPGIGDTADPGGAAMLWDFSTGTGGNTLTGPIAAVYAVAITPDGTRALTGGADGTARIWNLATGAELHTLTGHTKSVDAVAITPDGTRALTGGADGTARIWNLATGTELHTLTGHTANVYAVAITPDGTRAVTTGGDGTARIWNLATGTELHTLTGHTANVYAVAITPDGTRAVTTGGDGTARIWDLATGTELHTLNRHPKNVYAVAVTPDGTRGLTGGGHGTARIWDLATGTEIHRLTGHTQEVTAVAITPDGTRGLTGGADGTARIWNLATGTEIHTLTGHTQKVTAVTITPDGTRALTGGADGTARIWNLATGTELHTLTGHTESVQAVAITPDGTRALTASWDGTARYWDLYTGEQLQVVAMESSITSAQMSQVSIGITVVFGESSGAFTVLTADVS